VREGFEPCTVDGSDAPAIELDCMRVLQTKERAGGHVAHGAGGCSDLRL
jgi:hypothetical protein